VVVAFGQILPPEVLAQPPLGCWNGHGSLLPRWRGAGPIQWSLLEGDTHTGVGVMAMEEGMDTGPVLLERAIPIGLLENAQQLGQRLAALTADLLVEALPRIAAAGPGPQPERWARLGLTPQPEEGLTYARMLNRDDFSLDWNSSALAIHRKVMGLYPGATTSWQGKRLKLLVTEPLVQRLAEQLSPEGQLLAKQGGQTTTEVAPGRVLAIADGIGLVVATQGCPVLVREAQLEGKTASAGPALIQQLGARVGDHLGPEPQP
jgi:methionyl-tRNA formyltransferase